MLHLNGVRPEVDDQFVQALERLLNSFIRLAMFLMSTIRDSPYMPILILTDSVLM